MYAKSHFDGLVWWVISAWQVTLMGDETNERLLSKALQKNHGIFAIGRYVTAAFEAAAILEDVAAAVRMVMQIGTLNVLLPEGEGKLHDRYSHVHDQSLLSLWGIIYPRTPILKRMCHHDRPKAI